MFYRDLPRGRTARVITAFTIAALIPACLISCGDQSRPDVESPQSKAALARYHHFLEANSTKLVHWAETIVAKVGEGSLSKAASRYAASRVPYGRIGPVSELFASLDDRIDSTEAAAPPDGSGFNVIERAVFLRESTAGMGPTARRLLRDVKALRRKIHSANLKPDEIARGAEALLGRLTTQALPGKEEPYAHNDLADIAAGVEGLDAALRAMKPSLVEADPDLPKKIEAQLEKAYASIGQWGIFAREPDQTRPQEPGIAFAVYTEFSPAEIREFGQPVEGLVPLFAQAHGELAAP